MSVEIIKSLYKYSCDNNLVDENFYMPQKIDWVIDIDKDGNILTIQLHGLSKEEQRLALNVPFYPGRTRQQLSYLLVDKIEYTFGFSKKDTKKDIDSSQEKFALYLQKLEDCFNESNSDSVKAQIECVKKINNDISILEQHLPKNDSKKNTLFDKNGNSLMIPDITKNNIIFRINDDYIVYDSAVQEYAKKYFESLKQGKDGFCSILGKKRTIVKLHPEIKLGKIGFNFGPFNTNSSCHFGEEQGFNFPVSYEVVLGYVAAMKYFVGEGVEKHVYVLNRKNGSPFTVLTFWPEKNNDELSFFQDMSNNILDVRKKIASVKSGKQIITDMKFNLLILKSVENGGRFVSDDSQINKPVKDVFESIDKFFEETGYEDMNEAFKFKGIYSLAKCLFSPAIIKLSKGDKDLLGMYMEDLYFAAIDKNRKITKRIEKVLIQRCKSLDWIKGNHKFVMQSRLALVNWILNRNYERNRNMKMLDTKETHLYYNLGRLLALAEYLQEKATKSSGNYKYLKALSNKPENTSLILVDKINQYIEKSTIKKYKNYFKSILNDIISNLSCHEISHRTDVDNLMFLSGYGSQQKSLYTKKNTNKDTQKGDSNNE